MGAESLPDRPSGAFARAFRNATRGSDEIARLRDDNDKLRLAAVNLQNRVLELARENADLRTELGRRDDALYQIHKITAAYEDHVHTVAERAVASDDLQGSTKTPENLEADRG